jgi:hypothetical protein
MSKSKSKLPMVNGIVVFGGDFLKAGTSRVIVSTDEPMTVLESMRSYYGGNIRGKVVKSNSSTEELFTKELKEKLKSHKPDTLNMYKVNSSDVVKVLKEVFDVKTCKKLSFKQDSDSDSDNDNGNDGDSDSLHEEVKETKSTKKKVVAAVAAVAAVPIAVEAPVVETKSTKKKQVPLVVEAPVEVKESKSTSTSTKKKPVPSVVEAVQAPVEVKDSKSGKKKPEIVDTDHDVKDGKSIKKNLTTKLSSTSKVRIPLSDSEEDEELLNDD